MNTRQEWETELKQNEQTPEGIKFKVTITKVEPLTDYLPKAKGTEKDFLAKFSPAEVRVVHVALDIDVMGNKISGMLPMFVRVSGARGRIFGVGEPQFDLMKN